MREGRQGGAKVRIGERVVGPRSPCFVIAEAGVNHNGDPDLARRLVDAAAEAGADAVKFQTFRAERVISPEAPKARYQLDTTDASESQLEMARQLELDAETHRALQAHARQQGILFLSTPFDEDSADLLAELGVPAYKIGSGEITNWPLLRHVARLGAPVILSTGMSFIGEVEDAVRVIRGEGNDRVVLLHCVSAYPTPPAEANLQAMETLSRAFGVPVGFSDHTLDIQVPLAAVALEARVLEKHLTLDRSLPGPDHRASLEPEEFADLVAKVRDVESAMGDGRKRPMPSEEDVRRVARRSLVLTRDVREGERIGEEAIQVLRPGDGIEPRHLSRVVGRRVARDLERGTVLRWEDLL